MKRLQARGLAALCILACAGSLAAVPQTPVRPVIDTLHGASLTDPYRWLEGDERGEITAEVIAWTERQNAHTLSLIHI